MESEKYDTEIVSVFANGLGELGSIPGRVIPKTLKMVLDTSLLTLSTIRYLSRVKWSNQGKWVAPFPTLWFSSHWKGSLLVVLDYGRQLFYFNLYIYIYICKLADRSRGWPEGSLFNSYYNEVSGRALLISLNCSTYPCSVLYNAES